MSQGGFPNYCSKQRGFPILLPMVCMDAGGPGRAKRSGSSGNTSRRTPSTAIDWRRSASSDHVYVREREWEAAHTLWLWPDLSESMDFKSPLSVTSKRDRAIVLTLALADLLVRGGSASRCWVDAADGQPEGCDAARGIHRDTFSRPDPAVELAAARKSQPF